MCQPQPLLDSHVSRLPSRANLDNNYSDGSKRQGASDGERQGLQQHLQPMCAAVDHAPEGRQVQVQRVLTTGTTTTATAPLGTGMTCARYSYAQCVTASLTLTSGGRVPDTDMLSGTSSPISPASRMAKRTGAGGGGTTSGGCGACQREHEGYATDGLLEDLLSRGLGAVQPIQAKVKVGHVGAYSDGYAVHATGNGNATSFNAVAEAAVVFEQAPVQPIRVLSLGCGTSTGLGMDMRLLEGMVKCRRLWDAPIEFHGVDASRSRLAIIADYCSREHPLWELHVDVSTRKSNVANQQQQQGNEDARIAINACLVGIVDAREATDSAGREEVAADEDEVEDDVDLDMDCDFTPAAGAQVQQSQQQRQSQRAGGDEEDDDNDGAGAAAAGQVRIGVGDPNGRPPMLSRSKTNSLTGQGPGSAQLARQPKQTYAQTVAGIASLRHQSSSKRLVDILVAQKQREEEEEAAAAAAAAAGAAASSSSASSCSIEAGGGEGGPHGLGSGSTSNGSRAAEQPRKPKKPKPEVEAVRTVRESDGSVQLFQLTLPQFLRVSSAGKSKQGMAHALFRAADERGKRACGFDDDNSSGDDADGKHRREKVKRGNNAAAKGDPEPLVPSLKSCLKTSASEVGTAQHRNRSRSLDIHTGRSTAPPCNNAAEGGVKLPDTPAHATRHNSLASVDAGASGTATAKDSPRRKGSLSFAPSPAHAKSTATGRGSSFSGVSGDDGSSDTSRQGLAQRGMGEGATRSTRSMSLSSTTKLSESPPLSVSSNPIPKWRSALSSSIRTRQSTSSSSSASASSVSSVRGPSQSDKHALAAQAYDVILVHHWLYDTEVSASQANGQADAAAAASPQLDKCNSNSSMPKLSDVISHLLSLLSPNGTLVILHRQGKAMASARSVVESSLKFGGEGTNSSITSLPRAPTVTSDSITDALASVASSSAASLGTKARIGTIKVDEQTLNAHADTSWLCAAASEGLTRAYHTWEDMMQPQMDEDEERSARFGVPAPSSRSSNTGSALASTSGAGALSVQRPTPPNSVTRTSHNDLSRSSAASSSSSSKPSLSTLLRPMDVAFMSYLTGIDIQAHWPCVLGPGAMARFHAGIVGAADGDRQATGTTTTASRIQRQPSAPAPLRRSSMSKGSTGGLPIAIGANQSTSASSSNYGRSPFGRLMTTPTHPLPESILLNLLLSIDTASTSAGRGQPQSLAGYARLGSMRNLSAIAGSSVNVPAGAGRDQKACLDAAGAVASAAFDLSQFSVAFEPSPGANLLLLPDALIFAQVNNKEAASR